MKSFTIAMILAVACAAYIGAAPAESPKGNLILFQAKKELDIFIASNFFCCVIFGGPIQY